MKATEVVMGWTGYKADRLATREDALRAHIADDRILNGPVWSEGSRSTSRAWIVAEAREQGRVFPIIVAVFIEYQGGRWYVKDVAESMGPTVCDCPEVWLELVNPRGPYSQAWRFRVRQHWAQRRAAAARQNITDAGGL
jgi:hypothetical protein